MQVCMQNCLPNGVSMETPPGESCWLRFPGFINRQALMLKSRARGFYILSSADFGRQSYFLLSRLHVDLGSKAIPFPGPPHALAKHLMFRAPGRGAAMMCSFFLRKMWISSVEDGDLNRFIQILYLVGCPNSPHVICDSPNGIQWGLPGDPNVVPPTSGAELP